jgi:hypothetical protein
MPVGRDVHEYLNQPGPEAKLKKNGWKGAEIEAPPKIPFFESGMKGGGR